MRTTRTGKLLALLAFLLAVVQVPIALADNSFLSTPRVQISGKWLRYTPGLPEASRGAVSKTTFDMTISYHDTLSADSVPAGDPKRALALEVESVIKYWADALYQQSNGQHTLGTVYIYQGGKFGDKASVLWKANAWPTGAIAGYGKPGQVITFGDVFNSTTFVGAASTATSQANGGYTLGHETGHYVYALYDEYVATYTNPPRSWPWSSDVSPSGAAIMNSQWNAMKNNDGGWLNHSIAAFYVTSTDTAQKRMYGKSCWQVLLQAPSQDGVSGDTTVKPSRVQYSFSKPVTTSGDYLNAVTPGTHLAAAQANLKILWLAEATMVYQIVLDRSGSMGTNPDKPDDPTPLSYAKTAACNLVDSLPKNVYVGIVQFDDSTSQVYPITLIASNDAAAAATRAAAKAAINGLTSGGSTAIYDAASYALSQFVAQKTALSADLLGVTYLLTDGEDNSSSKSMGEVIGEYQAQKVPLITVGYGAGGQAGSSALTQLADGTGGQYFASPVDQAALQQVFFAALGKTSDAVSLGTFKETLAAGASTTKTFRVDSTLGTATFFAGWKGTAAGVTLTLTGPGGAVGIVSGDVQDQGGAISFSKRISGPAAGTWSLQLTNVTAASLDVSCSATGEPGTGTGYSVTLGLADGGSTVASSRPALLLARVNRNGVALKGATVVGTLTDPAGAVSPLTFRDDGTGGDATASDGIYSAVVSGYSGGTYKVDVTASNPGGTAQESYCGQSPSVQNPDDPAAAFNPYGAVVAENFERSSSFQFTTSGGAAPTVAPTGGGGGGGGGGCEALGLLPLVALLLIPALSLIRRRKG